MILKLHHNAYRCRDSGETRKFYEDFLGLRLAGTLEIKESKSGRRTDTLHTFYELGDGSYLAFFEAQNQIEVVREFLLKNQVSAAISGDCRFSAVPKLKSPCE